MTDNTENIVTKLTALRSAELDVEHNTCKAVDVMRAVCLLLDEVCLLDDSENDKFDEWVNDVRMAQCRIMGEHSWIYDHCGFWGHQYCAGCRAPKYKELIGMRCSDVFKRIGKISESEYNA